MSSASSKPIKKKKTESVLRKEILKLRVPLAFTGAYSMFNNVFMLVVPLYMLQLFDRVIGARSLETLAALTILAVGVLIVQGLLDYVRDRLLLGISMRLDRALAGKVFDSVFECYLNRPGTYPGQALNDIHTLRRFLGGRAITAFFDAPWAPIFLLVIFLIHGTLGMVVVFGIIIMITLNLVSEFATRKSTEDGQREQRLASTMVERSVQNREVLVAMGMLSRLRDRWLDRHSEALGRQAYGDNLQGMLHAVSHTMRFLLQIAVLGTGAYLVVEEQITPGMMIAANILLTRALGPFESALGMWQMFIMAREAYRRVDEILTAFPPDERGAAFPAPQGRLSVENVVATPPGSKATTLARVTFALEPGECLTIAGPSGAGKTTLARLISGAWKPAKGVVRLDGFDLRQWDPDVLGDHMGYLPQDVELFEGTIAENISRFKDADMHDIVLAAKRANAHDLIQRLPDGYATHIYEWGSGLSGGQRQRIGLARALFGEPRLVVLDEPNAALDGEGMTALMEALKEMKANGTTVVIVSHNTQLFQVADKIVFLRKGVMEMFGPRDKIIPKLTRPVPAEKLMKQQAQEQQSLPKAEGNQ